MSGEFPPEPTSDDCSNHVRGEWNGRRTLALWYPQMGGYVGHALAVVGDDDDCPDVYVWHDGSFPFSSEREPWDYTVQNPARLHLCAPDTFIGFGETLSSWLDETGEPPQAEPPSRMLLPAWQQDLLTARIVRDPEAG